MKHALLLLAIAPLACASNATAAPAPSAPAPASPAPAAPAPAAPAPAAPAPAPAAPAPAPAQPSITCAPSGVALFEIDLRADPDAKIATSTTKVFNNGAWTHDGTDGEGKPLAPTAGCLGKSDVSHLQTTLKGATWKVTTGKFHCMAVSATFTDYQVNGKPVFTERLCSGESLDDKSRAKLNAAVALVQAATKA